MCIKLALYKSKSGFYRPCEVIGFRSFYDEREDQTLIKFVRCKKKRWCSDEQIADYKEELIDTKW